MPGNNRIILESNIVIDTNRLEIRNLKQSDFPDFYIYRSNPDVAKYQGFDVMTTEQSIAFINGQQNKRLYDDGQWVQFGIENKSTQRIIGDCALKITTGDTGFAEIGITISHLEQKKGYAKETILGILNFLFRQNSIRRVVETVDSENIASINLLKSVGFRCEGHFIGNIFFKGKWGSELQYALLKREWNSMAH